LIYTLNSIHKMINGVQNCTINKFISFSLSVDSPERLLVTKMSAWFACEIKRTISFNFIRTTIDQFSKFSFCNFKSNWLCWWWWYGCWYFFGCGGRGWSTGRCCCPHCCVVVDGTSDDGVLLWTIFTSTIFDSPGALFIVFTMLFTVWSSLFTARFPLNPRLFLDRLPQSYWRNMSCNMKLSSYPFVIVNQSYFYVIRLKKKERKIY